MTESQITALTETLFKIIEKIDDSEKRDSLQNLFSSVPEFFVAPASIKKEYHHCEPGGLLAFTVKVYENTKIMHDYIVKDKADYSNDELIVACLLNNFGKAGHGDKSFYVQTSNNWRLKNGFVYEVNDCFVGYDIDDILMLHIMELGIKLSPKEYFAIKMSKKYESDERGVFNDNYGLLSNLLHQSNILSAKLEDNSNKPQVSKKVKAHNNNSVKIQETAINHPKVAEDLYKMFDSFSNKDK